MNTMESLEDLVGRFLKETDFTLQNALNYGGLGLSKTTGHANEIIAGVGFGEQQYSPERQVRMSEILGEMLFYWHVLATTTGLSFHEIIEEYMHSYEAIREKLQKDKITLQDMMDMKKYVKSSTLNELQLAKLEAEYQERKKKRERLLSR